MKWFGRKAGRDAARPALSRGFGIAFGTGDWPRSYEAQVREAYPTIRAYGASRLDRWTATGSGWTCAGFIWAASSHHLPTPDGACGHRITSMGQASYICWTWAIGKVRATQVLIADQQVVGARLSAIPAPTGGGTIDAEARAAVAAIIDRLATHGLIAA